jgi:pimeloyl-ACP methyl ester carboxylesterase
MKPSQSHILQVRGLRYHVRTWGDERSPRLVLLHGWMDVGASFQFLVDALARDWCVLAPDWRGFGQSGWCEDGYWFADYLADLTGPFLEAVVGGVVAAAGPGDPGRAPHRYPRRSHLCRQWQM